LIDLLAVAAELMIDEPQFAETANDAVRLAVAAQERAGVDVMTDGEQRRDSYASFIATRLDNCQLIPLTDLLPLVDHPEECPAPSACCCTPTAASLPSPTIRFAERRSPKQSLQPSLARQRERTSA
jgi:hypothetical protein